MYTSDRAARPSLFHQLNNSYVANSNISQEPEFNCTDYLKNSIVPKLKWIFHNIFILVTGYSCFASLY